MAAKHCTSSHAFPLPFTTTSLVAACCLSHHAAKAAAPPAMVPVVCLIEPYHRLWHVGPSPPHLIPFPAHVTATSDVCNGHRPAPVHQAQLVTAEAVGSNNGRVVESSTQRQS